MHGDFERILGSFKDRYGDKEGVAQFNAWVNKRSLDTSKPYGPDQIKKKECLHCSKCTGNCSTKESFQWAKPLIKLLKNDETGKTYEVEANFVITSMNGNLYTREENAQAISTLPNKRVDLNHQVKDPDWTINGCSMLAAAFENDCAEVLLHVKNGTKDPKGRDVQEAIDKGIIDCVSIEAGSEDFKPILLDGGAVGNQPVGMKYEGLALLDQDALPGIPLTRIRTLERVMESIFNEMLTFEKEKTPTVEVKEKMFENVKESFGDASFPDSCFAYVPDSAKGADGKKSDRKLPYKNADGSPDLPHVRNALARLNQTQGIPASEKDAIRTTLQDILKKADPNYKPSEAAAMTAQFCPICGAQLDENGACPSKDCPAFGAKIVASGEARAVVEAKFEGKNCPVCGQFMDAAGKCTNIQCVAVASGRKTGALSNEEIEALKKAKTDLEKAVADLNSKLEAKTRECSLAVAGNAERDSKVAVDFAEINEKLAKATRENVKNATLELENQKLKEEKIKIVSERDKAQAKAESYASNLGNLEKQLSEKAQIIGEQEKQITVQTKEKQELEEINDKKEAEKEALRADWNDEVARKKLAEERLQNKTVECSKLQIENAELLQFKAESIRSTAKLSGDLNESVKAKIALEAKVESLKTEHSNEIAKLKEAFETEKKALQSEITKRDAAVDKALLEQKRTYKALTDYKKICNENGYIMVDGQGNIVP